MTIPYTRLGHISLACKHFDETLKFYTETLGLPKKFELQGDIGSRKWEMSFIEVDKGQILELAPMDYLSDNTNNKRSFQHFCFEVDNFYAAVRALQSRGVKVYRGDSRTGQLYTEPLERYLPGPCGSLCAFFTDPEGNDIEIMQFTEKSLHNK